MLSKIRTVLSKPLFYYKSSSLIEGIFIVNVVPFPSSELKSKSPFIILTKDETIDKPKPTPPYSFEIDELV